MNEQEVKEFDENIVKGAGLAFQKLVDEKRKQNGELIFSKDGSIFKVKATKIVKD
jgi:hypothetical protein